MRTCSACATSTDETGSFCPACGAAFLVQAQSSGHVTADSGGRAEPGANALLGTSVDGFTFEAVLGGGSFGTVFRGTQRGLERRVALKVPTFEILVDPTMAKRFAREARSAAKIAHPGVVAIYGVGELEDGRPYLAMQFIDGQPLDKILEDGPVPAIRALRIIRDLAAALAETHLQQVVHRDLKPANVMWRRDRHGDDRITIVDFGIAVARPGNADATRLTSNGLIGTPHYMSPEQAQGENIDHRSDIYALGCILFELVTADTPFSGSGMEVLLAHMGHPVPTPSDRNPEVPVAVDRVVRRLMAKRPHDRPQTGDEVVEMIDDAISEVTAPSADGSTAESAAKTQRKKRPTAEPTVRAKQMLGNATTAPLGSSALRDLFDPPPLTETVGSTPRAKAGSRKGSRDAGTDDTGVADVIAQDAADHSAYARSSRQRSAVMTASEDVVDLPPPPRRARWLITGVLAGALAGGGAVFVATNTTDRGEQTSATPDGRSGSSSSGSGSAALDDDLSPTPGEVIGRRTIVSDDGEMSQKTTVYDPIIAGMRAPTVFEVWNGIGVPIEAPELVVTLEGPDGVAIGGTARASRRVKGRFVFNHVYPAPGRYVMRVFLPEAHTVFTIELDVEAR